MSDQLIDLLIRVFTAFVLLAVLVTEIMLVKELRETKLEMRAMRKGMTDLIIAVGLAQLFGLAANKLDKWISNR